MALHFWRHLHLLSADFTAYNVANLPDNSRILSNAHLKTGGINALSWTRPNRLRTYPFHHEVPRRTTLLAEVRENLERDGCAVLKGYLTSYGIASLTQEANSVADKGDETTHC